MQVSPHFVMELHLPIAASVNNSLFVEYIPSLDCVLTEPLRLIDSCFAPSEEVGLGIASDWEKLDRFRVEHAN